MDAFRTFPRLGQKNIHGITQAEVHCEEVALSDLAAQFGTPLFVYSKAALVSQVKLFQTAFNSTPALICYAVKANSNLNLLKLFGQMGLGCDIVSGGELVRALKAGIKPSQIVYSGVGKTKDEIKLGLQAGIRAFNVESSAEISHIEEVATHLKKVASINLRINPNIKVETHPHISTGLYQTKFGMDEETAKALVPKLKANPQILLTGLACHLGSQIQEISPYQAATQRMVGLAQWFQSQGFPLTTLDIGGGFGVRYSNENPPSVTDFAQVILNEIRPSGLKLILEPGRALVANAGVLLTQVLLTKSTPEKKFVVVDSAMNDLVRPALYEAYHEVEKVISVESDTALEKVDVVGPICETADFIATDRLLPRVNSGDLLFIRSAGAYAMAMASNYNSRGKAAEVLVEGKKATLIRRRETIEELLAPEIF